MSQRWRVVRASDLESEIGKAPDDVREIAYRWSYSTLYRHPLPADLHRRRHGTRAQGAVDPIRSGQRKNASVQHARIGGDWRLIWVVLPRTHVVFVAECVEHNDAAQYGKAHNRRLIAVAKAATKHLRKNPIRVQP